MGPDRGGNAASPQGESRPGSNWGQNRRLQFIDYRLRWDGQINRNDLTAFFGISVPQASLDFAKYLDAAPGNLTYDKSSRAYVATPKFKPLFPRSSARRYLNDLWAAASNVTETGTSFIGWRPSLDVVPVLGRGVDEQILARLVQAMRASRQVRVQYQSLARKEFTLRDLSPHSLVFDGFRWHVRAYCHLREQFQDFVLGRFDRVEMLLAPGKEWGDDHEWHNKLELVLIPHPDLSTAGRRAIERDYGMVKGEVRVECRQAMLLYALRNLRLDGDPKRQNPRTQQIILKNRDDLESYIQRFTTSA